MNFHNIGVIKKEETAPQQEISPSKLSTKIHLSTNAFEACTWAVANPPVNRSWGTKGPSTVLLKRTWGYWRMADYWI